MKRLLIIICFIFLFCLKGFAQSDYAVLVQESPAGAGEIKPGPGVHTFGINENVTLTTVARPGWRFVYWLGEVSDPTANRTMLAVDGPKIIIAVFQRDEYELPGGGSDMAVGSGEERLTRRSDNISSGDFSGGGGGDNPPSPPYYPPEPPNPPDNPPPVPDVPEPATVLFFGIGTWLVAINRKK